MSESRKFRCLASWVACALPLAAFAGGGSIDRKVPADANGEVVISNVSGTIDVRGWDRNEVQVTGTLGRGVERVDVDPSSGRTVIKVVLPRGSSHDGDADIEVSVPKGSRVEVSAVSADVSSRGVLGTQRLKSVSGEVTADIAGTESEVSSVSGDVTVRGDGKVSRLRVTSVSGNIDLANVSGKLDVVTVSGDARVHMGEAGEVRGRTTSGTLEVSGKLSNTSRVDVEGVSGDINLKLSAPAGLSMEIESFSGDIEGCMATKVERASKYGPGVRMNVRAVESGASVRAKTLSGDIDICDR